MRSFVELRQDAYGQHLEFVGRIYFREWPRLDPVDRMLIKDCQGEGRTCADWLLALETLFRRMLEQQKAAATQQQEKANG